MHVAQTMRDDLGKAGLTDIHIMSSSFLARAKDRSGNPMMMVINPDSITAVTEEKGQAQGSRRVPAAARRPGRRAPRRRREARSRPADTVGRRAA